MRITREFAPLRLYRKPSRRNGLGWITGCFENATEETTNPHVREGRRSSCGALPQGGAICCLIPPIISIFGILVKDLAAILPNTLANPRSTPNCDKSHPHNGSGFCEDLGTNTVQPRASIADRDAEKCVRIDAAIDFVPLPSCEKCETAGKPNAHPRGRPVPPIAPPCRRHFASRTDLNITNACFPPRPWPMPPCACSW